jgi:formylmethanofuran dehydrogenase subunit C
MQVTITPRRKFQISVEAEVISPDRFAGKSKADIEKMAVWEGNRAMQLGELFDVKADSAGSETKIVLSGDFSRVKRIGEGMKSGEIVINGNVDMHCGALMSGGKITVKGNADSWCGREMLGGEILVEGNAAHYVGAGYRGETKGIASGRITVTGNAGDFVGENMAGGELLINGSVGTLAGSGMTGGKLVIGGDAAIPGGDMKKGTIIVKGKIEMLPSFKAEGSETVDGAEMKKFVGDLANKGSGTVYVK